MKWLYVLALLTILLLQTACGGSTTQEPGISPTLSTPTPLHTPGSTQSADETRSSPAPSDPNVTTTPTSAIEALSAVQLTPTRAVTHSDERIVPENAASLVHVGDIQYGLHNLVLGLAWSPNGDLLAVSTGNDINIYNSPALNRLARLNVGAITQGLAFSPNGTLLAAGSRDSHLRVWDVSAIKDYKDEVSPYLKLVAHKKGVNCIAFSTNGTILATGGNDGVARLWDPIIGAHIGSLIGGTYAVPGIAFYPKDDILAVVNGNVVRLRDVKSERILGTFLTDNSLFSLAYHPDGGQLAASDTDHQVLIWNHEEAFRSGSEDYPEPAILNGNSGDVGKDQGLIWQLVFSPDGPLLVSAGGNAVYVWDFHELSLLTSLEGHQAAVTSVAFHPDGRLLASGSLDGSVRIWGLDPND